jgi:hypothetical protein
MKPVFSLERFILTKHVGPIRACLLLSLETVTAKRRRVAMEGL